MESATVRAAHVLGMEDKERKTLTDDLQALFTELKRLGYLDDYAPGEADSGDPEQR
jgi:hypothetical protein